MDVALEIERVVNPAQLKEFVFFPWKSGIYRGDAAWVPPLISEQFSLLDRSRSYFSGIGEFDLFLARENGKVVGRISAHVNHLYEKRYDSETGFFGFYEAFDDQRIADTLLGTAVDWVRSRGKKVLQGPQSFSIYDSIGFDIQGNDFLPSIGNLHFAPWYARHAEAAGFRKTIDWYSFLVRRSDHLAAYLRRAQELFAGSPARIVELDRKHIESRIREVIEIFNIAWEGNWGHLPLQDSQIEPFVDQLKMIAIPELANFAEVNGKTVGFIITVPDLSPALQALNGRMYFWRLPKFYYRLKRAKRLRTIIMGVLPEYRHQNVHNQMFAHNIARCLEMGFEEADCSLIVETNHPMIDSLKPFSPEITKTYRIFEKPVS